ncbi:tyrosine-type recombinase/integrase [Ancylobacter amanitiformis]|uniref:Integrase n=1 Tax=Ancylobacter amanitiformis TaxID=217069 RepID=A0ABU0LQ81_9HYPH|nr:integrase arm-type DNA-binding domain-containing protein [Ancylobacter amanitiformis]MDQ0510857.1 integrase [Ancylobacter amanitiformis]
MLTDIEIRRTKPRDRIFKLTDSGGLYLAISPTGGRQWRWKYRHGGKDRALSLGAYPQVGLAEARRERDAARSALKSGKDPNLERKRQIERKLNSTFAHMAREWYESRKSGWVDRHAHDVISSLERDVIPEIGQIDMNEIRPRDVLEALRRVERRGAVETAHRLRQRIEEIFAFAMGMGLAEDNPAIVVRKALKPVRRGRQPAVVTLDEAREVLRAAEAIPGHPTTKLALRLLALTVVRSGTIVTTPWEEVLPVLSSDLPVWRVSAERMKLKSHLKRDDSRDHMVPLSGQAVDVLKVLRVDNHRSPFVFPNVRFHHRHMSENALGYLLNRAGFHQRHVPHGWRATFSTIMNERHPADRPVIEMILAHTPENKVAAAYNRALYLDRRRELLQEWADLLLDGQATLKDIVTGPRR